VLAFGVKVALEVNFLAEKDIKEKVYINMAHIQRKRKKSSKECLAMNNAR